MTPLFSLQSWSVAPLHLPPALPHSDGHVTRDQSVMTCVTLDDDFHALMSQITNTSRARLIYLIALAKLFRARQQKIQRTSGDQWCHVSSEGQVSGAEE